jgi:predicted DCC family thiol-disulfide oxidoreductase YuxK
MEGHGCTDATRLTVLYDESCALCLRCRGWLLKQPCLVEVELLPAGSEAARERFGEVPWLRRELVVVDEHGHLWAGPAAYLTCLWATARYRSWSYRLATPALAPFAARFFVFVSKRRDWWNAWLEQNQRDCSWCDEVSVQLGPP